MEHLEWKGSNGGVHPSQYSFVYINAVSSLIVKETKAPKRKLNLGNQISDTRSRLSAI